MEAATQNSYIKPQGAGDKDNTGAGYFYSNTYTHTVHTLSNKISHNVTEYVFLHTALSFPFC